MKHALVGLALLVSVVGSAAPVRAGGDAYDETQDHPLRIAAYLVHPIGFAFEWVFLRPLHWVVSQPGLDRVFGHRPHGENRVY
jgi:hypothetical protein